MLSRSAQEGTMQKSDDASLRPDGSGASRRSVVRAALGLGLAACLPEPGVAAPDGGLLGHRVHGSGPETVVVLHEWLGDRNNYDPILPYLDQDRFTWLFADLRGYG